MLSQNRLSPTLEQQAILSAGLKAPSSSLMINSMAGCAKTATIEILARSLPVRPSVYVVFNRQNKIEAEKKFSSCENPWGHLGTASHVNVLTANGLGHGAWSKAIGKKLTLNDKKLFLILKQLLDNDRVRETGKDFFGNTLNIVRRARTLGLIPKQFEKKGLIPNDEAAWSEIAESLWISNPSEELFYYAERILAESIRQSFSGLIDFDDQIYMSALFGGVFPRYEVVFGDEVQDYSSLNQRQIQLTAKDRIILVGDHRQAIYAFRGADADSINNLRSLREEWLDFDLSVTFRCPKAIVRRQQNHAPGFTAADSNSEGIIHDWRGRDWSILDVKEVAPVGRIAILCRNNAPLFTAALRCIKAGFGATILGNEIGKGLIAIAKSISKSESESESETVQDFLVKLNTYCTNETAKAMLNNQEAKAELIQDKCACIRVVCEKEGILFVSDIIRTLDQLFNPSELNIICSTGHKAKGFEWPTVVFLDPEKIPSPHSKKRALTGDSTALEQEMNLKYVIETRAQETLILANSENMSWEQIRREQNHSTSTKDGEVASII